MAYRQEASGGFITSDLGRCVVNGGETAGDVAGGGSVQ